MGGVLKHPSTPPSVRACRTLSDHLLDRIWIGLSFKKIFTVHPFLLLQAARRAGEVRTAEALEAAAAALGPTALWVLSDGGDSHGPGLWQGGSGLTLLRFCCLIECLDLMASLELELGPVARVPQSGDEACRCPLFMGITDSPFPSQTRPPPPRRPRRDGVKAAAGQRRAPRSASGWPNWPRRSSRRCRIGSSGTPSADGRRKSSPGRTLVGCRRRTSGRCV